MRSTRIIATTLTKSSGVWSYRVVHIGYVLPRTWEPEAVPGVVCLLLIPGMYQKSAAEGPADVHTSPKKPISAIFRGVCTSVLHCRALSVHIPGMYKQHSVRASPSTEAEALSSAGTYPVCAAAQRTCIPAHQGKSPLLGRYIPGMCKWRSEAKGTGASKSKKNCYLCKTHIKQHKI